MSIDSALSIASYAITHVSDELSVVSNNVANAGTPGYSTETLTQSSLSADGVGYGVRSGTITRDVNAQLQADLFGQNATVTGLTTSQTALKAIDSSLGTVGDGYDISSLLGTLEDSFVSLSGEPDSAAEQTTVVNDAESLTNGINALSQSYTTARQGAEDDLVQAVGTLNTALSTIGSLSDQIVRLTAQGGDVADLENQRDAAMGTVSNLIDATFVSEPDGDMLVQTPSGLSLPTRSSSGPLTATDVTLSPSTTTPSAATSVQLGSQDVTAQLLGGRIGADIALRDNTLPTFQTQLDDFSAALTTRFTAQGLPLFTAPSGSPPDYTGFAGTITVNPTVSATPSIVRDGITGGTNANTTGASAYTGLINAVVQYAFGTSAASGVTQPGAGNAGTYGADTALSDLASSLVSGQSQVIGNIGTLTTNETALQTALQTQFSSESGVDIDAEMSKMLVLQNAYGANAKLISAAQTMFSDIINAVGS